jgi:hypothetical protein
MRSSMLSIILSASGGVLCAADVEARHVHFSHLRMKVRNHVDDAMKFAAVY